MALSNSDIFQRGLSCNCPRCGKGRLYDGLLRYASRCASCDLDYAEINADDGPAAFLIFIVLIIVVPLAGWVQVQFTPSLWVHLLLWVPLILGLTIGLMRPAKAILSGFKFHKRSA